MRKRKAKNSVSKIKKLGNENLKVNLNKEIDDKGIKNNIFMESHRKNLTIKKNKKRSTGSNIFKEKNHQNLLMSVSSSRNRVGNGCRILNRNICKENSFSLLKSLAIILMIITKISAQESTQISQDVLSQLQIEKIALLRSQQSSCGLFNQFLSPKSIMSNQRSHYQGSMGQVQRSPEVTLSFWASLDVVSFEEVYGKEVKESGRSGKISLFKIQNPEKPMVVDKSGKLVFKDHPPCPVSKKELLNNPQFLEFENVRTNPNCFTNGIYEGAISKSNPQAEQSLRVLQSQGANINTFSNPDSPFTKSQDNPTNAKPLLQSKKPEDSSPETKTQNKNNETPNQTENKKKLSPISHSMNKFIEISVIYKGSKIEQVPDSKGVKKPMKVWIFDLQIEFPFMREKSGSLNYSIESLSNQKFTPGNQIYVGLSLDFRGDRGKLYLKDFDDYNTLDQERDLSINTKGEVFLNKGFEIVTGDAHKAESALIYTDRSKNVIHFYKGKQSSNHVIKKIGRVYNLNMNFLYFPKVKNMIFFEFENNDLLDKGVVLETFFDANLKNAKSLNEISKTKEVSVDNPNPGFFFPFKKNLVQIKQIRELKNYYNSLESKGRIQKKLSIEGNPIMLKDAQNGFLFGMDSSLNLGKLRVSQADLIKSPSFYFKMKISEKIREQMIKINTEQKVKNKNFFTYEIMRIKDHENNSEILCQLESLDQNDGVRYEQYLEYVTKKFLDDPKMGYYDPYLIETEEEEESSTEIKAGQEKANHHNSNNSKKSQDSISKTSSGLISDKSEKRLKIVKKVKKLKPEKQIAEEKEALASKFLRVRIIFTDSKTSKTELVSMPFIKPGKLFEFLFSFVLLPRDNKHFVFFNRITGFDSVRSLDKAKFKYDQASFMLFDNQKKEKQNDVKLMNEVQTVPILNDKDKIEIKVEHGEKKNEDQKNETNETKNQNQQNETLKEEDKKKNETKEKTPIATEGNKDENKKSSPQENSESTEDKVKDEKNEISKPENNPQTNTLETKQDENNQNPKTTSNNENQNPKSSEEQKNIEESKETKNNEENETKTTESNNQNNETKKTDSENQNQQQASQTPNQNDQNSESNTKTNSESNTSGKSTETNQSNSQPTTSPVDVEQLKNSLSNEEDRIIKNTTNSIDKDKLESDGKLNPNPIVINSDGTETVNNQNSQQSSTTSRLLQSNNPRTVTEVAPETEIKAEPKETKNESSKPQTQKENNSNNNLIKIDTRKNEIDMPHIVAYHFAIVENFYGAIFNSQGAKTHDFKHSTSLEFFRLHYPKIPEKTLKEALASEASSLLSPDQKELPAKIHEKIMKFNPKVLGCESRCSIPLGESLSSNSCLGCSEGVLDYKTHQCLQFCPADLKNAGGVCVPCVSEACEERPKVKILIDRYQEDRFRISISDELHGMDQSNLGKLLKVEIKGVKPSFYEYEIIPTSNTTADLELKIKETLYNKTLRVYLDPKMIKSKPLYDSNRNGVESMETDLHIGTIAYLKSSEKRWVDAFSIIVAVLFFFALAMVLFFGVWTCFKPRALVDESLKRIVRFCTKVQFVGFLIFLNCQMSPQLRRFLKKIYQICVGFAQVFGGLNRQEYENHLNDRPTPVYERHINFEEHEVFRFFLQNFGLIFIIHALLVLAFISLQTFRLCKKMMGQNLEGVPETLLKAFNLNTLLWFFFFQLPIYVFCLLNLKYMTFSGHSLFVASTIITILYIVFFTLALAALVLSLIKFRKFSESRPDVSKTSSAYFSLSYYISGYRGVPKAYFFDAVYILFYVSHSVFLVYFYKWPSIHVMSAAMLLLGLLLAIFMVRPFLKTSEFVMEAGWGCMMFLVYVALAFMSYLDLDNQQALDERKVIGWVVLVLLFVSLLIYFIYVTYFFIKYVRESIVAGSEKTSTHMMEGMNTPNRTQKVYAQRDDNQMMDQNDDASDNYSNSAFQRRNGYGNSNLDSDTYSKGYGMGSSNFKKPQMEFNAPPKFQPNIKENSDGKFGSLGNLSKMSPHKIQTNARNTPMQPSLYRPRPDPSDDYSMTEDEEERNRNKKWDQIRERTRLTPEEKTGQEREVTAQLEERGINPKFGYLEELDQANQRAQGL